MFIHNKIKITIRIPTHQRYYRSFIENESEEQNSNNHPLIEAARVKSLGFLLLNP